MKVPPGACDCHVHVFGPAARFPLAPDRAYTPPDASIGELLALHKRLGFERVVIVQPSVYGTDNSCTVEALKKLGRRARGVAVIDAGSDLSEMQKAGVRGVRVNLHTSGLNDPGLIEEAAARVAPLGWHVQTFTMISVLKKTRELRRGARAPSRLGGRCGAVSQNRRRQPGAALRFLGGGAYEVRIPVCRAFFRGVGICSIPG